MKIKAAQYYDKNGWAYPAVEVDGTIYANLVIGFANPDYEKADKIAEIVRQSKHPLKELDKLGFKKP